jgi:cytochrome c-type biogenesis protein CcmE
MDPQAKRKIRLVVALTTAVLLAAALVYTSFSAATEAKEPSQLLNAAPGKSYDLTGKVVDGSETRLCESIAQIGAAQAQVAHCQPRSVTS